MQALDPKYAEKLEQILQEFLESNEYTTFMDSEEEEDYQLLREQYEPKLNILYEEVADKNPLQLINLELLIMNDAFEGIFLPKLLGYSVLRGEVNEQYKYKRPQSHFKQILLQICHSANFEYLKKRIGQTVQIGFALSSDIWITNLINEVTNRRVRYFLQGQKLKKYRELKERRIGYLLYQKQFKTDNYYTADFPKTKGELKIYFSELYHFLKVRIKSKADNQSIVPSIVEFLDNDAIQNTEEYVYALGLYTCFFDLEEEQDEHLKKCLANTRNSMDNFQELWLSFLLDIFESKLDLGAAADRRASARLDKSIDDDLSAYYKLMDEIHSKGYLHDEVIEAIRIFYNKHEGLSDINTCVRNVIFNYFRSLLENLDVTEYHELFEISKYYTIYVNVFNNQQFNQQLKDLNMKYVKKLLKKYTDKRGKDYQDIKKFVSATFRDLDFLTEKQIVELFKTRRKVKKA